MSNIPRISYVAEGKTDLIVLDSLVERFLGTDDYQVNEIQPPSSAFVNDQGPLGGGWHGVLRWCETAGAAAGGFANAIALANCDCLIIHVDADIAMEKELQSLALSAPCPPAKETCDKIRAHLLSLFGGSPPPKVVLCVPAQCTEAWVFAALHSDDAAQFAPLECRLEPERLLIQKPDKLVRDKDGAAKKQTAGYRAAADKIAANWPNATKTCGEAARFETECRAALARIGQSPPTP